MAERAQGFRLLLANWTHDPFVEAIEWELFGAVQEQDGTLLRLVEGRAPAEDGIPTIDLDDAVLIDPREPLPRGAIPDDVLGQIVTDTLWMETTAGLNVERGEVADRLRRTAGHVALIFDAYVPHAVMVWNGMLSQRAVVAATARARGIPVWYGERGPLPRTWYADPLGVNGGSSLVCAPRAPQLDQWLDRPLSLGERGQLKAELARTQSRGESAWGQPELLGPERWRRSLGLDEDTRVVFFPLQVDADTNLRFFSPYFHSNAEALAAVARALAGCENAFLLVKPHPKGHYALASIKQAIGGMGRCVEGINLQDALALADAVVTINSTAGAEAIWRQRPVLQLGTGILSGKGLVREYDPQIPMEDQLRALLAQGRLVDRTFRRGLRFYGYLRRAYLSRVDDPRDARRQLRAIIGACGHVDEPPWSQWPQLAQRFGWRPAERVIAQLCGIRPAPRRIVLVGYGQNGRRFYQQIERARSPMTEVQWCVWDDDPQVREAACVDGHSLFDPWDPGDEREGTMLLVTVRRPGPLRTLLCDRGGWDASRCLYLCDGSVGSGLISANPVEG